METINYIIPLCNAGRDFDERLINMNFILNDFLTKQTNVIVNAIIVEQIVDSQYNLFCDALKFPETLQHETIIVKHEDFVKPWLYNLGVNKAIGQHIIIAESDVYSNEDFFSNFLEFVNTEKLKWCFMWDKVEKITKESKKKLMQEHVLDLEGSDTRKPERGKCEGMGVYFRKDFWIDELHGANELFRKLGGNDNELAFRANYLTNKYPKFHNTIIHLWHPGSYMKKDKVRSDNVKMRIFMSYGNVDLIHEFLVKHGTGNDQPISKEHIPNFTAEIEKDSILLAGPWIGEFEWELFKWQAHIRYLAKSYKPKNVIIGLIHGHEFLYQDFSKKFLYYKPTGKQDKFKCDDKNPTFDSFAIKNVARLGIMSTITPDDRLLGNLEQEFIKLGNENDNGFDILVCATEDIKLPNLNIASIGIDSKCLPNTTDLRSLALNELVDVIASSKVVIGTSSNLMHLAALCDCPRIMWNVTNKQKYEKTCNPFLTPTVITNKESVADAINNFI